MDVAMYERALKRTRKVVAGTRRDQFDQPTPCPDWDVHALLNHIIGGCLSFAAGATGEARPMDDGTDHCAEDHAVAFDRAARAAIEVFSQPGILEREFVQSWGKTPGSAVLGLAIADAAVHGWDLATATGQEADIDDDIAEAIYGMTTSMMEPMGDFPRGDSFGPPIDVPDDAPPAHKALTYLGRTP